PCCLPSINTSRYQSRAAVGPCHRCGAMPSRIDPGTAKVSAITLASPLLKQSMYWHTAAIRSFVLISSLPCSLALANRNADDALMSLHLVEHVREGGLELECLLDLVGTHIGIFPIFEEARDLMLADKLDEFLRLGFPIFGEAFEVFEDSINAGGREESHSILGVLVEVCVEDPLIHEVGLPVDGKEDPSQVVQLEHGETLRLRRYGLLDVFGILIEHLLPTGDDFCENRKAVAGWTLGKDRAVSALFRLILGESSFGNRH